MEINRWSAGGYVHPLLYTALSRHQTLKSLRVSHPPINSSSPPSSLSASADPALISSLATSPHSSPLNRPPIISVPAFRTLRRLTLHNLPGISSLTDDYVPAVILSPNLESLSLSWRTPTLFGQMMALQRLLRNPRPLRTENAFACSGRPAFRSGQAALVSQKETLRLKELALRNIIFDCPLVGDLEGWADMRQLEKLSLLDCEIVDPTSWLELIGIGVSTSTGAGANSPYVLNSSPAASSTGSTPGCTQRTGSSTSTSTSMSHAVRSRIKSLRINSCASHWVSFLNHFRGLEELYILDPPVEMPTDEANRAGFLEAIIQHHGASLKKLRMCSRWHFEKMDVSKLFRACPGLEELGFSMVQSQWVCYVPALSTVIAIKGESTDFTHRTSSTYY